MKKKPSYIDIQINSTKGSWAFNPSTRIIKDKKRDKVIKEIEKNMMKEF